MEAQTTTSTNIHDEEKFASGVIDSKHEELARELSDNSSEEDHEHEPPVCHPVHHLTILTSVTAGLLLLERPLTLRL
jgi:hypothetical protein